MSSDRGGLLKARAESFARNLQNRLRGLSESGDSGWTDAASVDSEVYYDIDSSLTSPEEENAEPIFIAVKNRDALPLLQRSDSEASTYFDTVEDVEELAAFRTSLSVQPSLKHLPLGVLQRKNEDQPTHLPNGSTPITNGHVGSLESSATILDSTLQFEQEIMEDEIDLIGCMDNLVDVRSDFSGEVHVLEREIENCYNEGCLEDNNNFEEEIVIDLNSNCNIELSKSEAIQLSIDNSNKTSTDIFGNPEVQFCVLCDIEQIKSNLSNILSEDSLHVKNVDDEGHSNGEQICQNEPCGEEEKSRTNTIQSQFNKVENDSPNTNTTEEDKRVDDVRREDSNLQVFVSDEEGISFKDLLTVLKEELTSNDIASKENVENTKPTNEKEDLERLRPSIEVSEPSSSPSEAKLKTIDAEFDIEEKRKHFRRSSSLRSGKTPPSTPGRKKIVRFADVLGLDLADVKTFLDEVPTIPMSAFDDLKGIDLSPSTSHESENRFIIGVPQLEKILSPLFQQPCIQPNFLDRVRENNICLENAMVSDTTLFAITGLVRVKNMDFHKSVYVRYTINDWKSFSDLQARYVPNSCDGFSDKFAFVLYAHTLAIGQRLQFAVRFHTAGAQFWDSNGGVNYIFECTSLLPKLTAAPPLPTCPTETASFY